MEPHREKGLAALYFLLGAPTTLVAFTLLVSLLFRVLNPEIALEGRAFVAGYILGVLVGGGLLLSVGIVFLVAGFRRVSHARHVEPSRQASL